MGTLVIAFTGGITDVDSRSSAGHRGHRRRHDQRQLVLLDQRRHELEHAGAVANNNARLLAADASTRLYFQPNADYYGTLASAVTFRAWDQTSGSNGTLVDTSTNGGTTAFSSATDTASLVVNPVADTPSVTNATTNEDTQTTSDWSSRVTRPTVPK